MNFVKHLRSTTDRRYIQTYKAYSENSKLDLCLHECLLYYYRHCQLLVSSCFYTARSAFSSSRTAFLCSFKEKAESDRLKSRSTIKVISETAIKKSCLLTDVSNLFHIFATEEAGDCRSPITHYRRQSLRQGAVLWRTSL